VRIGDERFHGVLRYRGCCPLFLCAYSTCLRLANQSKRM
jgi:hypothetical protein